MQIDLSGKNALVTGGTTGIGFAAAKALADAGARVMVTGQNEERVRKAASQLGVQAKGVVADNRSVEAITRVSAQARDSFGKLDILVANAGVTWSAPIQAVSEADFDAQMAINFKGGFFAVQKCLPLMERGGSIVMTSSCLDAIGIPGMAVYAASKAAVRSLVRTLAAEFAPRGIRVNSVAPGPIDTPIYDKLGLSPADADKVRNEEAQATIMKRLGAPGEVGQAILFLASDAASYVTGANLRVDGGWTDI